MANLKNTEININSFIKIPSGTRSQRPANPEEGVFRYNTDENYPEYYGKYAQDLPFNSVDSSRVWINATTNFPYFDSIVDFPRGKRFLGGVFVGVINTTTNFDTNESFKFRLRYALFMAKITTSTYFATSANATGDLFIDEFSANGNNPFPLTRWNGLGVQEHFESLKGTTADIDSSSYPAFNYIKNLNIDNRTRTFNNTPHTVSKWYIPALDELELIYRYFKPTTATNSTGARSGSFPINSWNNGVNTSNNLPAYTTTSPSIGTNTNADAIALNDSILYLSSTFNSPLTNRTSSNVTIWGQRFYPINKTNPTTSELAGAQVSTARATLFRVIPVFRVVF